MHAGEVVTPNHSRMRLSVCKRARARRDNRVTLAVQSNGTVIKSHPVTHMWWRHHTGNMLQSKSTQGYKRVKLAPCDSQSHIL